jgi:S-(hydroxymethyl)mycothiol dehydrogenase
VQALRDLTGGFGPDVVIDAVGRPETYRQAFDARDLAGTVVLVGRADASDAAGDAADRVLRHGGALKSSWYGDCLPTRDFPLLIELSLQGRLPAGRLRQRADRAGDVEEAFHRMERGEVLRSVVVLDGRST